MNFEAKPQSLLTFRVGPVLCCAPSFPVRSIIPPPKLTHPPGSDSSQPGIFKHGSHIVKVFDLRQKFGVDKSEQTQPGNLIITILEKEGFAFWVDQILDVFDFPSEGWGDIPPAIPRGVFSRTLLLNKKIHLYSEFEKLATISDLGYLKHYIQQLKEQSNQGTGVKEKKTVSSTTSSNKAVSPSLKKESETPTSPVLKPNEDKQKSITDFKKGLSGTNKPVENKINTSNPIAVSSPISEKVEKPASASSKTTSTKQNKTSSTIKPVSAPASSTAKSIYQQRTTKPVSRTHLNNTRNTVTTKKDNVSTSSTPPVKRTVQDNDEPSSLGIILFFILLLAAMGAGIYYLFSETTSREYKYKKESTITYPKQNYEKELSYDESESDFTKPDSTVDEFISPSLKTDDITVTDEEKNNLLEQKIESSENNIAPTELEIENQEVENIEDKELSPTQAVEENDNNTAKPEILIKKDSETPLFTTEPDLIDKLAYRAEITKLDDEITITLHQSVADEKQQDSKAAIPLVTIEENKTEEAVISPPPVKKLKQEELKKEVATKKVIKEVIHIVVKGDTLWAIAKKYVNNPFLYPELARLSNIKNPHRIYPGNRVRIRFVKN